MRRRATIATSEEGFSAEAAQDIVVLEDADGPWDNRPGTVPPPRASRPAQPTTCAGAVAEKRAGPRDARAGAGENAAQASRRSQALLQTASLPALVERAGAGDPQAWGELVARFGGMIAATGRRYRLTPADVAELQQTTWLRLVENLHRIEQPERVGGWLATTARRESLHLLRRASKYYWGADQILANVPDRHLPDPDSGPIAEERESVVRAAWANLKPRCQELLLLLIADDPLGYKDLSKLLRMPVGSIGPTRGRCLEHLRRLVAEQQDISTI